MTEEEAFEEFMEREIEEHGSSSAQNRSRFKRVFGAGYREGIRYMLAEKAANR